MCDQTAKELQDALDAIDYDGGLNKDLPEKIGLVHLALENDGTVVAAFMNSADAAEFCTKKALCQMPFNTENRFGTQCPAVGTKYVA